MGANPTPTLANPVYEPQDLSPALPEDGYALILAVYPAVNEGKSSAAVYASARVAGRHVNIYGGRLAGAIQIVAVDVERGVVYSRNGERGKPVPLPLAMNPNPQPPVKGVASVESAEVYFAVDLVSHLGLPPQGGVYSVFLWLDEMASQPRIVELPGERTNLSSTLPWPNLLERKVGTGPPDGPPELKSEGSRMLGSTSGVFALLGLDFRSREVKWVNASGAAAVERFSFDPRSVFRGPGWLDAKEPPRRAFLTLCAGRQRSAVVTFEVA
jgi:hypothetical protein